jgi:uncharacterized membrane protein
MEVHLVDWLNILVRWVHIITGVAWIGASFYFVMLDTSLRPPKKEADRKRGVHGELWAVHGGGFYNSQKFLVGPQGEPLSQDLHWSKWEAYTTWLSGMFLLGLVYWLGAEIYLIDTNVMALSSFQAIGISIAVLTGGWVIYDRLCYSSLTDKVQLWLLFGLLSLAAYGLTQIYSGRGAYIMFGALLGTIMAANVFFVIIPGQKKMVDAIRSGEQPDAIHGLRGKQRSMHNTYFTLPVLFVMTSNHYAMTYNHELNWLLLIALSLSGALIRVFFVSRHGTGKPAYLIGLAGLILLTGISVLSVPEQTARAGMSPGAQVISIEKISAIVSQRCAVCHSARPVQPGFSAPPKGIVYDSDAQILAQAGIIYQQAVVTRSMPIGNMTGMNDEERALIGVWFTQVSQK